MKTTQNGYEAYQEANIAYKYQEKNFSTIMKSWSNTEFRNDSLMYDVIILDLNMPILDGYDACKKIKALYNNWSLMKRDIASFENEQISGQKDAMLFEIMPILIACSSDDMDSHIVKNRIKEYGFDHSITSPLTVPKIQDIMIQLL